jgi:hypothetical protein
MPDAQRTRGLAYKVESTRVRNHRYVETRPTFPAQWCYGLYAISPVSGL